ncbi:hypothetical protein BKA70DRAFT_1366851 [Coprinopsis sp. MPI-PUGE-AT-0042]|nr:hypothetical protein BKA70DRAFT_1366851 [Coprinopsis sp. MPI-PUGE-AT-0042]
MFSSSTIVRAALLVGSLFPVARSAVFDVVVGGPNGLKFEPEFVSAAPGDTVRFIFRAKNHTATQSLFDSPCAPAPGGFDTGFIEVDPALTEGFPVAELPISSTDAIWVYCKQGNHCSSSGMVFAINAGDRFDAFKASATAAAAPPAASSAVPSAVSSAAPSASASAPATPIFQRPSTSATTHTVIVGDGGLTFTPSNIKANRGDKVVFEFAAKNHTVTQSSFSDPCSPIAGGTGFDSGYQAVTAGLARPKYEITINGTEPVWAYCAQGAGMVFAVNAPDSGERTFSAFEALAKSSQGGSGGYGSPADPGSAASVRASFIGGALALLASIALL